MTERPSPRANRVTPLGAFEAVPQKGLFMGNRGILGPGRPWRSRAWVCCRLSFRDRRVSLDDPRRYTPLFFADEAVALAAGHRPCGECRHADYLAFKAAFGRAFSLSAPFKVGEMDRALHAARIRKGVQVTHAARFGTLPDGTFVTREDAPRTGPAREGRRAPALVPFGLRRARAGGARSERHRADPGAHRGRAEGRLPACRPR